MGTRSIYYRFLETDDEYFNYNSDPAAIPNQGRSFIYGLFLPDDVLEQIYFLNARQALILSPKE